jgi:predicted PolB exonuclease-like 3'-5' exonuclease
MDGTKFNYSNHIDLLDELTFYMPQAYGATRRFNFDFYTRAFGLVSPKSEGIDGSLVSVFYNEGDYQKIADYCMRDVDATWKLFLRIKNFLYSKF